MSQSCVSTLICRNVSSRTLEDYKNIEEALKGNEAAFSLLRKRYHVSVYSLIARMVKNTEDAEDLTQETFAKAFKRLDKFDFRGAFSSWLMVIASNNAIDFLRQRRIVFLSMEGREQVPALDFTDAAIRRKELRHRVREALANLGHPINQMIYLQFYEDYSYEKIAETLELPIGTVKGYLRKGKDMLTKLLREEWEE